MKSKPKKESKLILPLPTAGGGDELPPFLKARDISDKEITKITLLGGMRKSNSQFGEGIDLDCKIGSKKYSWTIKYDSGNYRRLFKRFGQNKWKGIVQVERKKHMGREYVAVIG